MPLKNTHEINVSLTIFALYISKGLNIHISLKSLSLNLSKSLISILV